ncbi:hypothetical protein WA026_005823 [Henosepilachna vigintioctopunctata]|uniref:Endonuclease-reverse transcriptase n=1 Tax=Henosepilachna vigintioctopunctata TaxID=420089 RepID=A0AAW1U2Y3_9CUCU
MMGLTIQDRIRYSWIRGQTKVKDVVECVKRSKWKWAGHLARTRYERWSAVTGDWEPRDRLKPRKRPHDRWDKELVDWLGIARKGETAARKSWQRQGRPSFCSGG